MFTIFILCITLHYSINFKKFNIQAATACHPVNQREVDELLAKCATELSPDRAGF